MSISVRGRLVVQRKTGRKGDFNIGDLVTEIGQFEVKDQLIEEYEPGTYAGLFLISWIEPDSYSWKGRVFVKVRATLDEIIVDDVDETPPQAADSHPPPACICPFRLARQVRGAGDIGDGDRTRLRPAAHRRRVHWHP